MSNFQPNQQTTRISEILNFSQFLSFSPRYIYDNLLSPPPADQSPVRQISAPNTTLDNLPHTVLRNITKQLPPHDRACLSRANWRFYFFIVMQTDLQIVVNDKVWFDFLTFCAQSKNAARLGEYYSHWVVKFDGVLTRNQPMIPEIGFVLKYAKNLKSLKIITDHHHRMSSGGLAKVLNENRRSLVSFELMGVGCLALYLGDIGKALQNLGKLEVLIVRGFGNCESDTGMTEFLTGVQRLSNLKKFAFGVEGNGYVEDRCFKEIVYSTFTSRILDDVFFETTVVGPLGAKALFDLLKNKRIRKFVLKTDRLHDIFTLSEGIKVSQCLENFSLNRTQLDPMSFQILVYAFFSSITRILHMKSLDLSDCCCSEDSLVDKALGKLLENQTHIETLVLPCFQIGFYNNYLVRGLFNTRSLQYLNLRSLEFSDREMALLSEILKAAKLEHLLLKISKYCGIAGFVAFNEALQSSKSLTHLELEVLRPLSVDRVISASLAQNKSIQRFCCRGIVSLVEICRVINVSCIDETNMIRVIDLSSVVEKRDDLTLLLKTFAQNCEDVDVNWIEAGVVFMGTPYSRKEERKVVRIIVGTHAKPHFDFLRKVILD
ncbi:hypothetical protein HK096_009175 [Nowakowskiella sp. JEL0078]|nr:hypothetical protein HK096_009175 [Nowakowskiella sp. JEL0078]